MESINDNERLQLELNQTQDISVGREVFYNFLSRSFEKEIDKPFLDMVADLIPHFESITGQSEDDNLSQGGLIISEFSNKVGGLEAEEEEELMQELARNFASLFLIGKGAIPTSSSFYLSPDRLRKQEPYFQVLDTYQKTGFVKPEKFKEDEDHIAMELLFMAVLSNLIGKSLESGEIEKASGYLIEQQTFLENHMLSWIPIFCERLIGIAEDREFYKSIAMLTAGFLAMDAEYLKDTELLFSGE